MNRIFIGFASLAVCLIIITGIGVYLLALYDVQQAKQQAAEKIAQSTAASLANQLTTMNTLLGNMAQDEDVIAAVSQRDELKCAQIEAKLGHYLPQALKVRILLPEHSEPDETSVPFMGYADLSMVQESFNKTSMPVIQGDNGPNRHLALTAQIKQNDQVIGIILASMKYDFVFKTIKSVSGTNSLFHLIQDQMILAESGNPALKTGSDGQMIKVNGSQWHIQYWSSKTVEPAELIIIITLVSVIVAICTAAFYFANRRFHQLILEDHNTLLKAIQDLLKGNLKGNYPLNLQEMKNILSSMIRYKRNMESPHDFHLPEIEVDQADDELYPLSD